MMSDGINVEVLGSHNERYPAKIQSFSGDNEIIVRFDDCPDVLSKVHTSIVYLITETGKNCEFHVGSDVLVHQKIEDPTLNITNVFKDVKLTHAWWPAKIQKLKGCFAAVSFKSRENENSTDIVELSSLRPFPLTRSISRNDIHIHEMVVPDDLCEYCEYYDIRGDLNRWCGPTIAVNFDKTNKRLQIYSTQKEVVRRALLLDASFMRVLRQKKLIHIQKDELTKRLNDTMKNQYVEEFTVSEELMGLSIGSQGNNIKKAREIDGVISIDLDDRTHTFTISAQTQEAAKSARAQLEYLKKIFYVPMDIVSKIIGRNGNQIQDIIDQSGVMRVRVVEGPDLGNWKDEENKHLLADHVPFIFVGSSISIRDACLLLEFSIDHHREMDRLQKERDEIHREIRNNNKTTVTNFKYMNHSANEKEVGEHFNPLNNNSINRPFNPRGRNRGRGLYKNVSNSDVERNDNYADDNSNYRTNPRNGSYRRGVNNFRQGSLPPNSVNGQHNGNRRFNQQEDDTDDYTSATNDSENGRPNNSNGRNGNVNQKLRGNKNGRGRGGPGGGGREAGGRNNGNHIFSKGSKTSDDNNGGSLKNEDIQVHYDAESNEK